jgi:fucose 4-O-acetylase-like acetyltransferase
MERERILWIDFAKVFGIWLVILGHIEIPANFRNFIYVFHMPLFFFISGYLEKDSNIKDVFINGIRKLIIPYILFYLLSYGLWFLNVFFRHKELYHNGPIEYLLVKPLLGMLFGSGYHTQYSIMVNIQLWFLCALFFVKIFHCIVIKISNGNIVLIALGNILIIGLVSLLKKFNVDLLLSVDSALLGFLFFCIGYFITHKELITHTIPNTPLPPPPPTKKLSALLGGIENLTCDLNLY